MAEVEPKVARLSLSIPRVSAFDEVFGNDELVRLIAHHCFRITPSRPISISFGRFKSIVESINDPLAELMAEIDKFDTCHHTASQGSLQQAMCLHPSIIQQYEHRVKHRYGGGFYNLFNLKKVLGCILFDHGGFDELEKRRASRDRHRDAANCAVKVSGAALYEKRANALASRMRSIDGKLARMSCCPFDSWGDVDAFGEEFMRNWTSCAGIDAFFEPTVSSKTPLKDVVSAVKALSSWLEISARHGFAQIEEYKRLSKCSTTSAFDPAFVTQLVPNFASSLAELKQVENARIAAARQAEIEAARAAAKVADDLWNARVLVKANKIYTTGVVCVHNYCKNKTKAKCEHVMCGACCRGCIAHKKVV